MTNDIERVAKLADDTLIRSTDSDGLLIWEGYPQDILAFEQAVLAKRDEEWRKQIDETSNTEIESLQAKLAMLQEIALDAERWHPRDTMLGKELRMQAYNARNATQSDVDAFMAKKKVEWEKGVLEEVADYADEAHYRTLPSSEIRRISKERGGVR